jgi:gamma-glutamylcyclotransferase (GGCT)/AIG2-like uncharacterized protein YtfP
MLYFAYGSNMSIALMRRRCPGATAIGRARLAGWRLIVSRDGYASIVPAGGSSVHGVLWRLTPRDCAALNAYESLDSGLYVRRLLKVDVDRRALPALVYVGRGASDGRPKPGYWELVIAAAREWQLPQAYVRELERWLPARSRAARPAEVGEI